MRQFDACDVLEGACIEEGELAAIGRRVSETEWDLLDLLSGGGPA